MLNDDDDLGRRLTAAVAEGARSRRLESTFFMINVIFLLLLFFVVAGNLNLNIEVSPPRSDTELAMQAADLEVVADASGRLSLDGVEVSLDELARRLAGRGKVPGLSIAADAGVDAVVIARVLDALRDTGIERVALVTLSRPGADGPSTP